MSIQLRVGEALSDGPKFSTFPIIVRVSEAERSSSDLVPGPSLCPPNKGPEPQFRKSVSQKGVND